MNPDLVVIGSHRAQYGRHCLFLERFQNWAFWAELGTCFCFRALNYDCCTNACDISYISKQM